MTYMIKIKSIIKYPLANGGKQKGELRLGVAVKLGLAAATIDFCVSRSAFCVLRSFFVLR